MPLPLDLPGRPDERVLRQLVSALIYEGIVDAAPLDAASLDAGPSAGEAAFALGWSLGGLAYRCRASIGPFGRLRIVAGSIEAAADADRWEQASLGRLIGDLPGEGDAKGRLLAELERTIALCRWNEANVPCMPRRQLGFSALDAALEEGHPYHPSFKARTGFSEADHAAYGPEAGESFQLVWLAIERRLVHQNLPYGEAAFWISELGEAVWSELFARRHAAVPFPEGHALLPLHPFQWRAIKDGRLAAWLGDGKAVFLGAAGPRYRASQSVRTLMNAEDGERANVKLAMDMVNTSSLRTIEPHSVATAPVLSRWLASIVAGDPLLEERYPLAILPEYAGIVADRDGPLAGHLAAIWRRSVESTLSAGEAAVPFNALMMMEDDGRPFIDEWVSRFGLSVWLDRLVEVAIMPVWHLLVGHGIATEAHGQNMVLVHRDGWPVRLVLRDFHDSLEYVPGFLRDLKKVPDFTALDPAYARALPNAFYWMDEVTDLRDLLLDTIFVFNLTEVSLLLQQAYDLPERLFWERIADRLERYATEHGLAGRQAALRHGEPFFATESLLAAKLSPGSSGLSHRVPNPFARATKPAAGSLCHRLMEGAAR